METRLTGGELDTLIALVEQGPLWDGDVPSKAGRDSLIERGLASKVIVGGEYGYQASTYLGARAYCDHYPNADGTASDGIKEAKANRLAGRLLKRVKS